MAKLTIDGVEIEAEDGQSVLTAARDNGFHIPHFCFHAKLKVAGNCRMCLVDIENVPKLQIACGTPIRDGMVVTTDSARVEKARRAVLEFLLINHPLDCPTCDQAGECKLQDYCYKYGQQESRFSEEKHTFPRLDIGPYISRDQNRCMHCTRCIRFIRDVAGSEELALAERGGHTVVGPYLDKSLESPFSLNLAEVCPVGALTSRLFRFRGRVWLMDKARTLCAGCARGCNCFAWSQKGELLRLTPADNDDVNSCWLCDEGRRSIEKVDNEDRIKNASMAGDGAVPDDVLDAVVAKLKPLIDTDQAHKVAVLGSATLTNEDNILVRKLATEVIGTDKIAFIKQPKTDRPFGPSEAMLTEWFIRDDKTPNARGAADMLSGARPAPEIETIIEAMGQGEVTVLLAFGADPAGEVDGAESAMQRLGFLMATATHGTRTTALAQVVLPEASAYEKDGTFTNEAGRLQRLRRAVAPVGEARSAWQTAGDLAGRLGAKWNYNGASAVFEQIAAEVTDYKGLVFETLPAAGVSVHDPEPAPAAETETTEPADDASEEDAPAENG